MLSAARQTADHACCLEELIIITQLSRVLQAAVPAAVLCLSASFSTPVWSQWYVGLGSGSAQLDTATTPATAVHDTDHPSRPTSRFPWNAVVGFATERFSYEAFHARFSDVELGPVGQLDREVTGLLGRAALFESPCVAGLSFGLDAAVGVARIRSNYREVTPLASPSEIVAFAAVGASVQLGGGISARAQYDHFDSDTRLLSATLIKGFGAASDCGFNTPQRFAATAVSGLSAAAKETAAVQAEPEATPTTETAPAPASDAIAQFADLRFNRDSSFLTDVALAQLDQLAERMRRYPGLVLEVQGHSDRAEWGGTELALSADRARRVARALVQRGVASERLQLSGYAASRPVADVLQAELNRRVQFRILSLR